jgi:hypothetical protein
MLALPADTLMTDSDADTARRLHMTPEQFARLTPRQRLAYRRLLDAEMGVKLWLEGKGPKPGGIIICDARAHRPGKRQ